MPLLDHFRPPVTASVPWDSFHAGWAYEMARLLNHSLLNLGYRATPFVQLGTQLQVDVASLDQDPPAPGPNGAGGTAVAPQPWSPPAATLFVPAVFPDDLEVQVFETALGSRLVAAVELVSPRNKDRPETRRGFAAKCAAYLQRGVGLVVVDVVTTRQPNLHDEWVDLMGQPEALRFPTAAALYAAAYRPSGREGTGQVEVWPYDLTLGQPLPTAPLALRNGPTVPLDLETSYQQTRLGLGL